jgi:hypothetical protein
VTVDWDKMGSSLAEWIVELEGAEESLYCGEKFKLQFKFGQRYPFESPQVRNRNCALCFGDWVTSNFHSTIACHVGKCDMWHYIILHRFAEEELCLKRKHLALLNIVDLAHTVFHARGWSGAQGEIGGTRLGTNNVVFHYQF